jgi:hypothetical protein
MKAALRNQPRIPSFSNTLEGVIDPNECSPAVARFAQAKVRQDDSSTKMREAAGAFVWYD